MVTDRFKGKPIRKLKERSILCNNVHRNLVLITTYKIRQYRTQKLLKEELTL